MAPSADIGDEHAVFQPGHGTAPDIAGQGIANPIGEHPVGGDDARLARRALGNETLARAARRIEDAVDQVFSSAQATPFEFGGRAGTAALRDAVLSNL